MGCAASKLENEDTVRRCKERRRLIKEAVHSRHHLAAAHSDYLRSLRLTGSSLSNFAVGEPLLVSPHTPSVLLPSSDSHLSPVPPPRYVSPSPPPPPHHVSPPRHVSQPPPPAPPPATSSSFNHYRKKPNPAMKLPHILSESSLANTPRGRNVNDFPPNFTYKADMNYSETQSQTDGASSVWNWENFYPPSPPGSEFFEKRDMKNDDKSSMRSDSFDRYSVKSVRKEEEDRRSNYDLKQEKDSKRDDLSDRRSNKGGNRVHNYKQQREYNDKSSVYSDFFDRRSNKSDIRSHSFHSREDKDNNSNYDNNYRKKENHHLDVEEEGEETEREEVQYSEWDDHYNTTSSSSSEGDERESLRSEIRPRSNLGSERRTVLPEYVKSEKVYDDGASSVSWNKGGGGEVSNDMRMVVRHRNLVEIVAAIREYFDKAATAGEQVAEMLETGRAQMDRSFSKLKKTVYHSSGVFTNLSSSWTSKPPLAVKYQFEPSSNVEPGGSKSLCSTLERLLAWEKKLYQEVKAREGVKIENEKKLSSLQSQECRGDNEVKLDKTKTEIKRLQSLIVVTSQAVSTTSSAIIGVRDAELVPQLVELCHGFMYMWRSMNQFHEVQNQIVQQVRGLVNQAMKGESTSDLHRQATCDLESAVSAWHSSFCRLIKFQRDFIHNLHGWFKLTLLPINTEPFNGTIENSEAFSFYDEWKLALERVPDTVASEAIKSFINVVHSISLKQTEEVKIKKRTESASKELEKKSSSLRKIEKKYYHSYSMVGIGLPDIGPDNGHVLDARDPLSEKKLELENCRRKVEDEMLRHSKAVEVTRAMTLNNVQTGLPGVFQAMTSFSALIMEALETVCTRSYAIK